MENLKHTPGPWAKDYGGTLGHIKTLCNPEVHTKTVCVYGYKYSGSVLTDEEIEYNGRLISTAPEMLESLITAYKLLINCTQYYSTIEVLKNSIEKATGLKIEEVL